MASDNKVQVTERATRLLCVAPSSFVADFLKHLVNLQSFKVESAENSQEALKQFSKHSDWGVVVIAIENEEGIFTLLKQLKSNPQLFIIVYSQAVNVNCKRRLEAFAAGATMIANDAGAIQSVLRQIAAQWKEDGAYVCPVCGYKGLSEAALHLHDPLYHSSRGLPMTHPCPICRETSFPHSRNVYAIHLHNEHGPMECREPKFPKFAAFALVVCRRKDGKFLMVHEPAPIANGLPNFWLPAGRVDAGESFVEAALRETEEEGGIKARVVGVLNFSLSDLVPRVTFLAEPLDDSEVPRSIPNWESVGAMWVEARDLGLLTNNDYRAPDPALYFPKIASGEMKSFPLASDPFEELETLIRRLTTESLAKRETYSTKFGTQIVHAWQRLATVYPTISQTR